MDISTVFTFQYVSINTEETDRKNITEEKDLHSNMFLLIQDHGNKSFDLLVYIYIPICFY